MFDFLLNRSNIGNYNKCEIIEIFGMKKNSKIPFNIFTLIVFENTKQIDIEGLMSEKLHKFENIKDINWGIKRRIVDISIVEKLYDDLLNKKIFQIDKQLEIGSLKLLPEQYIQPEDSFSKPQLNYILKNNYKYGSYLLEFFDEDKNNCQFLLDEPQTLNSFSERLSEIIPIKIGNLSDRLGNIIFQFPINSFSMTWTTIKNKELHKYEGLKFEIKSRNDSFDINNLFIRLYEENDNSVTRQRLIQVKDNTTKILLDDCFGTTIEVFDKKSSLLLYKNEFSIMKQMNLNMQIMEHQNRVFYINGKIQKIEVSHHQNSVYGKEKNKKYDEWIRDRKYEQELKELEKNKSFIQYFGNQKEKALLDIRTLISKYGKNGVYIWDPYLSADDIKNVLYFSQKAYVSLKAITGLKQNSNKEIAKQEIITKLNEDDKQFLFLNLEVRAKIGSNGYDFHDRFIIFPLEKPKVWSLGISINQIGESHHILQKVQNAQHILNAFNDLWKKLEKEECLVWKNR
ncbi:MAG: VPA1262 family N-terminal domain-containing protein [Aliarcobacter cryaerophilus]|nr:VPA1262 family N-terminal domain-containing protein [Aliarcobacter cryaerophilus]